MIKTQDALVKTEDGSSYQLVHLSNGPYKDIYFICRRVVAGKDQFDLLENMKLHYVRGVYT